MILLKPKQEQAALLLASGKLGVDVAKEVGVTPETISHWKRDSAFQARTNQHKIEMVAATQDRLRIITGKALEGMEDLIENSSSETVKLKACSEIIKHGVFKHPEVLVWGIGNTEDDESEKK